MAVAAVAALDEVKVNIATRANPVMSSSVKLRFNMRISLLRDLFYGCRAGFSRP